MAIGVLLVKEQRQDFPGPTFRTLAIGVLESKRDVNAPGFVPVEGMTSIMLDGPNGGRRDIVGSPVEIFNLLRENNGFLVVNHDPVRKVYIPDPRQNKGVTPEEPRVGLSGSFPQP